MSIFQRSSPFLIFTRYPRCTGMPHAQTPPALGPCSQKVTVAGGDGGVEDLWAAVMAGGDAGPVLQPADHDLDAVAAPGAARVVADGGVARLPAAGEGRSALIRWIKPASNGAYPLASNASWNQSGSWTQSATGHSAPGSTAAPLHCRRPRRSTSSPAAATSREMAEPRRPVTSRKCWCNRWPGRRS